jgi:tRNA1(Val) A37 N6-methylase TrmN6
MRALDMSCDPMPAKCLGVTDDAILGGKLRLFQLQSGHRFGHDAVLLAAAVPARPGEQAIELGAGVGAAGLALLARVPRLRLTMVEIEPALAKLAAENIARNGFSEQARTLNLDIAAPARSFASLGLASGMGDHVFMNPPFNDASRQASPDRLRRAAHRAAKNTLSTWLRAATRLLRPAGKLTLIWRSDGLGEMLRALSPAYGAVTILPVHPNARKPAIRVIIRAIKGSRAPMSILPGLVLNEDGAASASAERVLRGGRALSLGWEIT